jgi:hypothetical protein
MLALPAATSAHDCAAPGTKAAAWVAQYRASGAPRIEWRSTSGVRAKIAVDGCLVIIHAENPIILEPPEAAALGAWLVEWYGVQP